MDFQVLEESWETLTQRILTHLQTEKESMEKTIFIPPPFFFFKEVSKQKPQTLMTWRTQLILNWFLSPWNEESANSIGTTSSLHRPDFSSLCNKMEIRCPF